MTTRFAVNVIGYIDDPLDKYTQLQVFDMLDRKSITECFKPMHVVEIVTKEIHTTARIDKKKVSSRRLGDRR